MASLGHQTYRFKVSIFRKRNFGTWKPSLCICVGLNLCASVMTRLIAVYMNMYMQNINAQVFTTWANVTKSTYSFITSVTSLVSSLE